MRYTLLTVLAAVLLVAADAKDDAKKDKEALQGTWKVLSAEEAGMEQGDAKEYSMIFAGDTFTIRRGSEDFIKGTYKLDASKKLKEIDMTLTEAPGDEKGKTVHGIYSLEKDELKFCLGKPGEDARPKEFTTTGTEHLAATLKKSKD
jgi:uncharacterized protein (TIGR03067 family)